MLSWECVYRWLEVYGVDFLLAWRVAPNDDDWFDVGGEG